VWKGNWKDLWKEGNESLTNRGIIPWRIPVLLRLPSSEPAQRWPPGLFKRGLQTRRHCGTMTNAARNALAAEISPGL